MAMVLHDLSFEFTDISKCQRSWNFGPLHQLPDRLPAWALGGFLISGFDLEAPHPVQNVINPNPAQAAELFALLYPNLTWPELVRLLHQPGLAAQLDCDLLLASYGTKSDPRFQKTSEFLRQWPLPIQNFISEKDIRAFDVTIVDQLPLNVQIELLNLLIATQPSKTQFCQMLDLCGELILMETSLTEIAEILKSPKPIEDLRKKRFPMTTEKDFEFKNSVQDLPWPKVVSAQALRRGDIQGIEVKFFAKDVADLEKTLGGLRSVATTWKQKNEPDPAL